MRITLVVVGKTVHTYLNEGIADYTKRIGFYLPFDMIYINDIKNAKSISQNQQKEIEGTSILKIIDTTDFVVLLDEHGKQFTSIDFSKYIERKMLTTHKRLVFVIGGPYGFSESVKNRSNEKVSLSNMTFPHDLIRLIFVEQLYRAMTITRNEPYHHE